MSSTASRTSKLDSEAQGEDSRAKKKESATAGRSASESARLMWLALSLTPMIGPTRGRRLVDHMGSVEAIFHASLTTLEAARIPAQSAQSIFSGRSMAMAEEELMKAEAAGAKVVTRSDDEYPSLLNEIYDPPLALYIKGDVASLSMPGIAVVGTRHPTPYGIGMAERLSCDLASRGLTIISGMARGVDAAAHRGALHGKGKTVAIWGTGIDQVYPRENKRIAEAILEGGGALATEFAVGTFPAPQNFPIRNRIISGLSRGVLVIEAGEYSGTRITARSAMEQHREVFAVPGNVTNRNSWGPNTLIKQGAKLTATWEDVWEELPADLQRELAERCPSESKPGDTASLFQDAQLSPHEKKLLKALKADVVTQLDSLIEQLEGELSSSEIFAALFELELAGKVKQMPGKNYVKTF